MAEWDQFEPVAPLSGEEPPPEEDWNQFQPNKVRIMNYGPVAGEHHRAAMVGPLGNKLEPHDVAVSPDLGLKLGQWIEVAGKPRRVADWSYISPGKPTSKTVEIRDGEDQGYGTMRVLAPDQVPTAMAVDLQETRIEKAKPVKIQELEVRKAQPVNGAAQQPKTWDQFEAVSNEGMPQAEPGAWDQFETVLPSPDVPPVTMERLPPAYRESIPGTGLPPWSEYAAAALRRGEFGEAAKIAGQATAEGVRRGLNLPVEGPISAQDIGGIMAPSGPPLVGRDYLPREEREPVSAAGTVKKAGYNLLVDMANFFNSPEGAAVTAATGGAAAIKPVIGRFVEMGFGADAARNAIDAAREGRWSDALESLGLTALLGRGAGKAAKAEFPVERPVPRVVTPGEAVGLEPIAHELPGQIGAPETARVDPAAVAAELQARRTAGPTGETPVPQPQLAPETSVPATPLSGVPPPPRTIKTFEEIPEEFVREKPPLTEQPTGTPPVPTEAITGEYARGTEFSPLGDAIRRRVNTLVDGPLNKITLGHPEKGLAAKISGDPQYARDFALKQAEKFPDEAPKYQKIAEYIEKEWPLELPLQARYAEEKSQTELFRPAAQQATLPRQISPQPALPVNTGVPVAEADIRAYLSQSLDIPIRAGLNVPGGMKGVAGLYRVKPETIRTKLRNDIPTIAHETGHYVHHLLFTDNQGRPSQFAGGFDTELMPLGRVTSKPNYPVSLVRKEGVAEFVREWLTDRSQAIAKAPKFAHYFENTLQRDFPQTWDIFSNARGQIAQFISQPGWEKARSRIVFDPKRPRATFRQWLSKKYTDWFNELAPIDRTMRQLTEFGLDPAVARQVSERAINYKGGWRGKADFDLEFDQTDINGKHVGPGLKTILKGLDPKELSDFSTYVALKRADEKVGQGIKTGFEGELTDADVRKRMSDLAPRFEPRRQQLIQFSEHALRLLGDSGFFTTQQLAQIRAANRDYVPFYRIYEGVKDVGVGPRGSGKSGGFVNTSSGVLRMRGSDRQIIDPLESIIKNNYTFRDLAERNRIGLEFVNAVEATQGGGRVGESVIKPVKPTKISHEEIVAHMERLGLDESDIKAMGDDIGMTLWRATNGISPKDGVFRVWEKGNERLFQVDDGDLLRALALSDSVDASVMKMFPLFRPFAAITKMLRTGATLTPEFIVRNPFRDQITGAVFSKYGFVPFFDGFRGMLSVLGKDAYYRDWIKSGGRYAGLYDIEGPTMRKTLERVIRDPKALELAWSWVRHPLQTLGAISGAFEQATRVGEFAKAIKSGADPVIAANASKDVALNFSRSGLKGKIVNQLMAFFNAGLQDLDKMVRAHREAPVRTATKAFMYITVPSIVAWVLGKDDPKIQNLPEWRKSFFWNVNIGGNVFSLPKPFLLGALYGTSVEKALDYAYGRDPNAVRKALGAIYQSGSPARGDMIAATNAFKPLVENISNYSFFMGRPLVSESQHNLSPGMQFSPSTSETAKFAGKTLNVSPIKIDNLIRGYFGGLGKYGTDAVDWFMLKAQGDDTPAPPAKDISQYPLIRGFMRQPYEASEYVQRFYKAIDTAETRLNDFRAYGQQLDTPGMRGFLGKNKDELVWYNAESGETTTMGQLRSIRDNMSDINKAMVAIQQSRSISPEEKSRRLILLGEARDKLAETAFKTFVHPTDRAKVF